MEENKMREFFEKHVDWMMETAKKYGALLMIVLIIWYGVKATWFWITMPILGLTCANEVLRLSGYKLDINLLPIIAGWIFIFSLGRHLFEKKS
jgi:hypothetical protein